MRTSIKLTETFTKIKTRVFLDNIEFMQQGKTSTYIRFSSGAELMVEESLSEIEKMIGA